MFELRLDSIASWIQDRGYRSVAVQLPEGVKIDALGISDFLSSNTKADITILGDPCYGACDLFSDYKKIADALVHFGHSPIHPQENDTDILFVEIRADPDIENAIIAVSEKLPKKVGLLATVQYIGLMQKTKDILESRGKEVFIGKGDCRIFHPGQVLGCNYSSAVSVNDSVEAFLYLGEGDFHPLAAAFGVKKEMFVLNPLSGEIRKVDEERDRLLRKRFAAIEKARTAESFLVIVCTKSGQDRSATADFLIKKVKERGKKAYKIVMNEIGPNALLPYKVDAYINTACPRIAIDDSARYSRPMLTVTEAEIVLGLREWEGYEFDSITNP
ncbi:2-(3-amino-3-carboxypropyl)histidine synthase [Candidatus Methanoplasma termitum]|uniref:2-(3-amino-3-carboxypropyl)histidine synthase n=1 Tax=Candidatus Methanoplasma termitum TaxID=1577791 RepID=A0A0A7LEZ5_9ARCH|nr:diphthamide biosynthesis enzyme Dph2 [Candidatus Methanoplasma termitum]AIZ56076.1 2-(3-amino-3-carboxypropyl)histidine synthase [Candidatus Methanoplasma termitum]MCL2333794.1 diphthamide biosynthesis enzyme Dph2 [Candidatus Methanoplasma sp.]